MKKITFALISLLTLLTTLCSCSSDKDEPQMTNYVSIAVDGNSIINEDDDEGVKINIQLAYAPTSDATIALSLSGNDANVATITPSTVNIAAGSKTATATVKSNNKHSLSLPLVLKVEASFSDANMKSDGKACSVTINPDSDIPELTDEQIALINGYKEKFNIDITKLLGKVSVSTVITYNDDDKTETFASMVDSHTFTGTTIITLSSKATADKPVLKMTANAMGLAAFNYNLLRKKTLEDEEFYLQTPYGKAVMENIGYDYSKETFTMTLDGIEVNTSDMSLSFTGTKHTYMDEDVTTIPFDYTFSAWDRLKAMADAGKSFIVDDGDTKSEVSVQDIIDGGGSINPYSFFDNTDIIEDAEYTSYPNIYVSPTGKIDFTKGQMTFAFPWYMDNTYGCQRVEVTYTFNK